MVNTYILVNPHIEGDFKSKIKAKNSNEAANIFYKNLSEHFNNSVPKFHFSIQKGSSGEGKYYHFEVKENRDDDEVIFNVKPYTIRGEEESIKRFESKLANFKSKMNQDGGKHDKHNKHKKSKHDDSSDSSDFDISEDNVYKRAKSYMPLNQPIYYWWYDPYMYRLDTLYVPTFYSYVTPYIELSLKI
jgi:hypothetical protein